MKTELSTPTGIANQNDDRQIWIRSSLAWFGLLVLAFVNGALREIGMKKLLQIADPLAHQLSCLTGVALWTAFAAAVWSRLQILSLRDAVWVGFGWLAATALFETFLLNRNLSWQQVLDTYAFWNGEFWGLALLWIGLLPIACWLWLGKRKPVRS